MINLFKNISPEQTQKTGDWKVEDLYLKNVVKTYHDRRGNLTHAIDHFSLEIKKGEFTTLVGPSGCGKTTVLRLIAGFETPDSGEVLMSGKSIINIPAFNRHMPMVFQNYALFPHLSIYDNIAYGLKIRKVPRNIIKNDVEMLLQLVNLVGMENRYPKEISGGQQQRVALARALVIKPKIILFDEPLSNLDVKLRMQTRMEIKRLQNLLGITTLYVTHDQEEALSMSDTIVVMKSGKIEQIGSPETIYHHPKSIFVADFIGNTNFVEGTVESILDNCFKINVQDKILTIPTHQARDEINKGDIVLLGIKPEAINILKPGESDQNNFSGTIRHTYFRGTITEFEVEFNNTIINVISPKEVRFPQSFARNERICLSADPNSIYIFKKE
jgi:iron(III) transport system ATP-binding protein